MNNLIVFEFDKDNNKNKTKDNAVWWNPGNIKEICKYKSNKQLLHCNDYMYKKIKYACKYEMNDFIRTHTSHPFHLNRVLQEAIKYENMELIKWVLSNDSKYLDIAATLDLCSSKYPNVLKRLDILSLLVGKTDSFNAPECIAIRLYKSEAIVERSIPVDTVF
jgi:hypothetical protein